MRQLIHLFLTLSAPLTVATYTVLVRGLLKRKKWAKAELFWLRLTRACVGRERAGRRGNTEEFLVASDEMGAENEKGRVKMQGPTYMRHRRMVMANAALAVTVLEKYAWKPSVGPILQDTEVANLGRDCDSSSSTPTASSSSSPSPPSSTQKPPPPPIRLTPITLPEPLVSFKRVSRPDIDLFLLQNMQALYGVQPNEGCLTVMMQSAQMGEGMDDCCVQGGVGQYFVHFPPFLAHFFLLPTSSLSSATVTASAVGTRPNPDAVQTRASLVNQLYALTGPPTQKYPAQ